MGIFARSRSKRRFSRRLMDAETREFVEDVLDETTEMFRTPSGDFQLAALCEQAFAEGHTSDLDWLRSRGVDPHRFYARELAPSWEGLTREQRVERIDRFIELSHELGRTQPEDHPDDRLLDMLASVHLKVLLLAWAFDRTYGYMDQLMNGPLQYRIHRRSRAERGKRRTRRRTR
jgi:hypothetical protein